MVGNVRYNTVNLQATNHMRGGHGNEKNPLCCYDDGDVHAHHGHVHDLLRKLFRYVLHHKGKTLCRIKFRGVYSACYRETLSESPDFFTGKVQRIMDNYFERLVRANFRFGRMCRCTLYITK